MISIVDLQGYHKVRDRAVEIVELYTELDPRMSGGYYNVYSLDIINGEIDANIRPSTSGTGSVVRIPREVLQLEGDNLKKYLQSVIEEKRAAEEARRKKLTCDKCGHYKGNDYPMILDSVWR